jgi:hypothetical protein
MKSTPTRALLRLPLATLSRVALGLQCPCSVLLWGRFQYSARKPVLLVTTISSPWTITNKRMVLPALTKRVLLAQIETNLKRLDLDTVGNEGCCPC